MTDAEPLRVLVVTQLFPNSVDPTFAPFNRLQFVALGSRCRVHVLGVIPWFPAARFLAPNSAAWRFRDVVQQETMDDVVVNHPRVLHVPRIGQPFAPWLYAASLWPRVRGLRGLVDVVLGSWAYPDGAAALLLARALGTAGAVKVHGSDLNVVAERRTLRPMLKSTLARADRVIAVSRPLAEKAIALGASRERTVVIINGVDHAVFRPRPRADARRDLGQQADGQSILYVGHLERAKGVLDLLEAFEKGFLDQSSVKLVLVGAGSELPRCRALAARNPGRVLVTGPLPATDVARWIAACDVLSLPSWNEGTPNVVLEAVASGRPVVATETGGIPDILHSPYMGELVPVHDVATLVQALRRCLGTTYDPDRIAAAAPGPWSESAARLLEVLRGAVAARRLAVG